MSWLKDTFRKMFGNRLYIVSGATLVGLFTMLSLMGLEIQCEDLVVCDELHCVTYCNVTNNGYRSVYLYNYDDWTMNFSPEVENFDLYVKYYGKWRYTNFTMDTRLGNIPDDRKYVFVFPRYSTKEFKLVVDLKDADRVKYTFGELDPVLVGYKKLCGKTVKEVPVYEDVLVKMYLDKEMLNNSFKDYLSDEGGYYRWYNSTVIKRYRKVFEDNPLDCYGIRIGGVEMYAGGVNVVDDRVVLWSTPVGDRNYEEFGGCRDFEVEKGACEERLIT